jgi:hypothetical protein
LEEEEEENRGRKASREGGEVFASGYLNAAISLQLAAIGTPFLEEPRLFHLCPNTPSCVIDTGDSYTKMWNTQGIKLTFQLHLTLRLRMCGATPPFLHTHLWHALLYLSNN